VTGWWNTLLSRFTGLVGETAHQQELRERARRERGWAAVNRAAEADWLAAGDREQAEVHGRQAFLAEVRARGFEVRADTERRGAR